MKIILDGSYSDYLMHCNGFSCGFNMPPALKSKDGKKETAWGLPPYGKRMPFLVDEYPACPDNWMRSEGKVKSFFVPVKEGYGMWLDFNGNEKHSNHVAMLISVQGINPITGMPCEDGQLEQYVEECPKHKTKFGPDRHCEKCGYKWPKQNYISTTTTPNGQIWLDGFRTADGIVRQYLLTQEKMRGVASNIIGKDRVFAIGVSFFLSKEKKPVQNYGVLRGDIAKGIDWGAGCATMDWMDNTNRYCHATSINYQCCDLNIIDNTNSGGGTSSSINYIGTLGTKGTPGSYGTKGLRKKLSLSQTVSTSSCTTLMPTDAIDLSQPPRFYSPVHTPINWQTPHKKYDGTKVTAKQLEVGAGANINQQICDDSEKLEFWHNESEAMVVINYCLEDDAVKIIKAGKVAIESHPEGFLQKVPVGN